MGSDGPGLGVVEVGVTPEGFDVVEGEVGVGEDASAAVKGLVVAVASTLRETKSRTNKESKAYGVGVSKGEEDGCRSPSLRAGHP
jgi:hypothetical protein